MEKEVLKEPRFVEEIVAIIRSGLSDEELMERLQDYHEKDIAQSLEVLTKQERINLYNILGPEWMSEIFSFIDEPEEYIAEIGIDKLAAVINEMDSDDAVDLLEDLDESVKDKLRPILDEDVKAAWSVLYPRTGNEGGNPKGGNAPVGTRLCIAKCSVLYPLSAGLRKVGVRNPERRF